MNTVFRRDSRANFGSSLSVTDELNPLLAAVHAVSSRSPSHQLFISVGGSTPKAEKRVSFKDVAPRPPEPEPLVAQRKAAKHARKQSRTVNSAGMNLLERFLSRDNIYDGSEAERHVHFAFSGDQQRGSRRETSPDTRRRLSRSCDHLDDDTFSPRLPPIRRRPTKHVSASFYRPVETREETSQNRGVSEEDDLLFEARFGSKFAFWNKFGYKSREN
ncbi:unnamed protein product [Caenorhabditis auriculariae]|uniref:Uncharacterized protein n=1 Tax=Caenorhabditis auriculariae TaxID=2777116 RepID=A0A8S1H0N4_9PELO|nr:unnamed protein product [Caenorhabditis auriculariae]